MKKIILLLAFCAIALSGKAAFPYDYNTFFASSATGSGVLETGVSAVLNTWYNGTVTGGANPTLITPSDLSYTDGASANYVDNSAGKAIYINSPSTARNSIFYLTSTGYTTGTYYVSYLLNVATGTAPATTTQLMNFNQSSTGSAAYGRIYIKQSTGNTGFVLTTNSYSGTVSSASSELSYGTTHLIILKYVMSASPASAQAYLFIDPTLGGTEGTPTLTAVAYTTAALTVKGLVIQSIPSFNGKIAGLRLSSTWADAAKAASAAAPLSTPTGISTTATSNSDFSASWSAVPNALSYIVKTYIGGTNLVNTTNVASGTSATVSGLMSGLDYTYKVTAVGDGTTYSNSESSATSVSTTGKVSTISTDLSDGTWGTVGIVTPASGSYGNLAINGYDLTSTIVYTGSKTGPKGETHTNRLALDKSANGGAVILPTLNSVAQIEVHATFGSIPTAGTPKTFTLEEYNTSTNTWSVVDTYSQTDLTWSSSGDVIFITNISRASAVKLRIANKMSSGLYICQIIARTTAPALLSVSPSTADAITATTATANWTAVTGATSYIVKVYLQKHNADLGILTGSTSLKFTGTASGESASSLAVTGLQADSTYNYTVQAIGDGDVAYSDSYISSKSANFVMASQLATPIMDVATNVWKYGLDANWLAVTSAVSYDVYLYQGVTLIATQNVIAPIVTATFASLTPETLYTYKVVAKGTGSAPFDSNVSAASAEVLTDLATSIRNANAASTLVLSGKTITTTQLGNMLIYNLQGELILQANAINKVDTNLSSGMYVVRFTNQNGKQTTQKISIR